MPQARPSLPHTGGSRDRHWGMVRPPALWAPSAQSSLGPTAHPQDWGTLSSAKGRSWSSGVGEIPFGAGGDPCLPGSPDRLCGPDSWTLRAL